MLDDGRRVATGGRRLTLADSHDPIPATFHARGSLRTRSNRADKGDDSVVSRAIGSPRSTSPISASTPLPRRRPIYIIYVYVYIPCHSPLADLRPTPFFSPLVRLLTRTFIFKILFSFFSLTLPRYIYACIMCVCTRRHDVLKHSIRSYSIYYCYYCYNYFDILREDRGKKKRKNRRGCTFSNARDERRVAACGYIGISRATRISHFAHERYLKTGKKSRAVSDVTVP